MPFKQYKAEHQGRGPLEDLYSRATGGQGIFGRLGLREERGLTDQLINTVSSNPEFSGLEGLLEAGRSPLTRSQHAQFRSSVIQSALNTRVINAGYDDYVRNSANLRANAVGPDDLLQLETFDVAAKHAHEKSLSADEAIRASGIQEMGAILAAQRAYLTTNEQQRLELESSENAQRETIRGEIQGTYNAQILAPTIQDEANYRSIAAQLEQGEGGQAAPNAMTSAVLEYAGAQLRASDDGNWSFSIGPLGLSDAAVPTMTYSQLRNQLNAAHQGRRAFMDEQAMALGEQAKKRGFGINGAQVSDLLFPMADAIYRQREQESAPPPPTVDNIGAKAETVNTTIGNLGRGLMPNYTRLASDALSFLFDKNNPSEEDLITRPRERLPVNGDPPPRIPISNRFQAR